MNSYILLDRSGSMNNRWTEAVSSINTYVSGLKEVQGDYAVTLASFDSTTVFDYPTPNLENPNLQPVATPVKFNNFQTSQNPYPVPRRISTFDILRDRVNTRNWRDLSTTEISPRGQTPLFDATAKLVNLALSHNNDRAVLVIMTDGEENASTEIRDSNQVKSMLDKCRERGYQIVFLGADFDNVRQAKSMGTAYDSTIRASGLMGMNNATRETARMATNYFASGSSMTYSAEARAAATSNVSNERNAKKGLTPKAS